MQALKRSRRTKDPQMVSAAALVHPASASERWAWCGRCASEPAYTVPRCAEPEAGAAPAAPTQHDETALHYRGGISVLRTVPLAARTCALPAIARGQTLKGLVKATRLRGAAVLCGHSTPSARAQPTHDLTLPSCNAPVPAPFSLALPRTPCLTSCDGFTCLLYPCFL